MIKIKGKVKFFNPNKGYGFILGEDEEDYFVHVSSLPEGIDSLTEGVEVSFDFIKTEKGLQAKNVTLEG